MLVDIYIYRVKNLSNMDMSRVSNQTFLCHACGTLQCDWNEAGPVHWNSKGYATIAMLPLYLVCMDWVVEDSYLSICLDIREQEIWVDSMITRNHLSIHFFLQSFHSFLVLPVLTISALAYYCGWVLHTSFSHHLGSYIHVKYCNGLF